MPAGADRSLTGTPTLRVLPANSHPVAAYRAAAAVESPAGSCGPRGVTYTVHVGDSVGDARLAGGMPSSVGPGGEAVPSSPTEGFSPRSDDEACHVRSYYRVMLGRKSVHAPDCFAGGFIGVDFDIHEDLSRKLPENWRDFNKQYIPVFLSRHSEKTHIGAVLSPDWAHLSRLAGSLAR